MKTTRWRSLALSLILVGVSSVMVLALPSFSDENIAAGNLNPTDTIKVMEIEVRRSSGEDVTLSAINIRNLGSADSGEIEKIIVRDGGDILGQEDNLSGIDGTNGVTINLGGFEMTGTTHVLRIFVLIGTTVTGGETVQLECIVDYVREGVAGSSGRIRDLTEETIRNGGFDEIGDSSPDDGFLNPDDVTVVQLATFNDIDANGSAVRWVQTGPQTIVKVENLGTATATDIAQVQVTLTIGGNDYVWAWGAWNPASPMTFEHDDFVGPGPANPPEVPDNGGVTVQVEFRVAGTAAVTDGRTIRTKTSLLVRELGEGADGEDVDYEQSITSTTTQTIRKQGFEKVEDETATLSSGTAATNDVVIQQVRAYDEDSNANNVRADQVYIRNTGTADGGEIDKIVVKAGGTTLLTLDTAEIVNFRTGSWYVLDTTKVVPDDEDELFKFEYTIGVPVDGHTFRPAVRIQGSEAPGGTDYPSDEVTYPDSLGLYEPGFEFIDNVTPPSGGTAYSAQRLLAQKIWVEDLDEDDDDVVIDPVVVKNIGSASGNPDITKIEIWRQDVEDGPEIKIGEEDVLDGLRTGGVRVDIDNDNIVQDAAGGAGTWLLIYLQIAEPEEMVEGRTIQLETRVLHTERNGTYDKNADSNQWILETNHRPVPDFTFAEAEAAAAASVSPKVADFDYDQVIQFTGTATDVDADAIETWHWDFGDGNASDEQNPTHQYPNGGTFDVTLTVTDARGVTGEVTKQIEVEGPPNQAPEIDEITADPEDPAVDDDIDFEAEITDPDQPAATAFEYLWEFGDEDDSTSTLAAPTFSYDTAGAYTVTLTVTDAQGATDTDTIDVSVGNEDPVIGGLTATPTTPNTGDDVTLQATGVTDADDDPIDHYEWDFGDGTTNDDGTQQVVHIYGAPGTYTVSVVAVDDRGGRSEAEELEITVAGPTRVVMRAYPNPAATVATISYFLPTGATTPELWIFDLNRNQILRQALPAGATEFDWNLRDEAGTAVSNGLYFCMITATSAADKAITSDVFRLLVAR